MASVLIVRENAVTRRIERLLAEEGHRCLAGRSRMDQRCDLVIVGIDNGDEDAKKLLRRIRLRHPGYVPGVLASTREQPRLDADLRLAVEDVITARTPPSLTRIKLEGLLRIKGKLNRLDTRCGNMRLQLESLAAAAHSIDQELDLASKLQSSLFPPADFTFPGSRFATKLIAASVVSGDFYDIFRLDERHVGFYVADARGHGVPAALLTIYVKKGLWSKDIKGNTYRIVGPAEALAKLNDDLIAEQFMDIPFVTMLYAVYNMSTRELVWSSAGHPPAFVLAPTGHKHMLEAGGPLLGVVHDDFEEGRIQLDIHEKVVLYTDGVERLRAKATGKTGMEAFAQLVSELAHESVGNIVRGVFALGLGHLRGKRPDDDVTLLAMEPIPEEHTP
ncbi:MAG: SpoIIE family protein phosphatase [Planctomycetota bacterium]